MIGKESCVPSTCVMAVWFGLLPAWFGLWLESCKANPEVSFLIVTDQEIGNVPANVHVLSGTLLDVRERLSAVCGVPVQLSRPYKLCDYKPFMGSAFADELRGYDYWGFCDIDLVFGNLTSYFRDLNLGKYDKFLPLGHLFIVRNKPEITESWRLPLHDEEIWRRIVSTEENCAFDETFFNEILLEHKFDVCLDHPFADITTRQSRFALGARTCVRNGHFEYGIRRYENHNQQVFWWRDGHAGRTSLVQGRAVEDEFMYVHFQKRRFSIEQVNVVPGENFYFGSKGFFSAKDYNDTQRVIATVNPYKYPMDSIEGMLFYIRAIAGKAKQKAQGSLF